MGQSDTKKLNKHGEITVPSGTPDLVIFRGEVEERFWQAAVRPRRYAASQRAILWCRDEFEIF